MAEITSSMGISNLRRDIASEEKNSKNPKMQFFIQICTTKKETDALPMFRNLVCSNNDTLSGFLKRLLGYECRPSTSVLLPFVNEPPIPILKRSSNSLKSMCLKIFSSSNSLKIVPRTYAINIDYILTKTKKLLSSTAHLIWL